MAITQLTPQLPITDAFRAEYLTYYRMLPLAIVDDTLRVAVSGEPHPDAIEDLRQSYGVTVTLVPVERGELEEAIRRVFAASESVVELVRDLDASVGEGAALDEPLTDLRDLANQPPVIRFVNLLIREAHDGRASDIHLEATRDGLRARLRIDGVLTDLPSPPRALQAAVVSRIKLLAELDIAERRAPQDGRIRVRLESRELDLRVSTVPTLYGESVVLRLLDRGGQAVGLDELGMAPETLEAFRRLAEPGPRHRARHRPDRLRQDHDALRRARAPRRVGRKDRHRRGPGRVPPRRASPRCRSTPRPGSPSPRRSAASCARTPTCSWWARCATPRPPGSRCRRR